MINFFFIFKLWKCMRENMKPMTQTGTGSTPAASSGAPTGGSGAPHFKHDVRF